MRQRKGLKKKSNDKSKRQSKNQRLKQINAELPENVTGMRTVVQVHCPFLLAIKDRDLSTIPQPPTAEEQSKAYKSFVKSKLLKLGLERFSWDWDSSWTHPFNKIMSIIIYKTLDFALLSCEYNNYTWVTEHNSHVIVSALMEKYFYHLQSAWRAQQKDGGFTALAAQFCDPGVCSETEEVELNGAVILRKMKLP
ncbi:hypothetical protein PPACK8108_LOCUS2064 [Phakopsora pachyrhizi]|uniref:Uncharacterized protein n=1 Tax=Phakopsora pachyrhizi TaxID=170000 RepID=A0AAV0AI66_PHAPC|nr:hypothetical protein PPACK8108_LOCUS2064 [Phakopsora pachyrhizi]